MLLPEREKRKDYGPRDKQIIDPGLFRPLDWDSPDRDA